MHVRTRPSCVGKGDLSSLWVCLPEQRFPANSIAGSSVRGHFWLGEWDSGLSHLVCCVPGAQRNRLEPRLMQFMEWHAEAARDLRVPNFWDIRMLVLSRIAPHLKLSLMHDSTSPKVLQHNREEVLAKGLGPVREVTIRRPIWERYGLASFLAIAGRYSSCPPPPLAVGGGGGCGAPASGQWVASSTSCPLGYRALVSLSIPHSQILQKVYISTGLIPVNRDSPQKAESFSLPTVEVLALMAMAVFGSVFCPPPPRATAWSRVGKERWDILALLTVGKGVPHTAEFGFCLWCCCMFACILTKILGSKGCLLQPLALPMGCHAWPV